MNIHHLELFYYVARHGGITEAVRRMPYGIQQPAVSGQVARLEENLGVVLFQRRPFALTAAGTKLYQAIEPFFSNLDKLAGEIREEQVEHANIGASTIVLRDHLPELMRTLKARFPGFQISLREGYPVDLENLLQAGEIDLAVTLLEGRAVPGIRRVPLIDLPLTLLVETRSSINSIDQLWKRGRILEPLICLPGPESVCKNFQRGLSRLKVEWYPTIEVSSIELIHSYVANGFGIGLSVVLPQASADPRIRCLPLPQSTFKPVRIGAMWRGKLSPLLRALVDDLQARARLLAQSARCP